MSIILSARSEAQSLENGSFFLVGDTFLNLFCTFLQNRKERGRSGKNLIIILKKGFESFAYFLFENKKKTCAKRNSLMGLSFL